MFCSNPANVTTGIIQFIKLIAFKTKPLKTVTVNMTESNAVAAAQNSALVIITACKTVITSYKSQKSNV